MAVGTCIHSWVCRDVLVRQTPANLHRCRPTPPSPRGADEAASGPYRALRNCRSAHPSLISLSAFGPSMRSSGRDTPLGRVTQKSRFPQSRGRQAWPRKTRGKAEENSSDHGSFQRERGRLGRVESVSDTSGAAVAVCYRHAGLRSVRPSRILQRDSGARGGHSLEETGCHHKAVVD